jgi:hypothetical protein
MMSFLLKKKGSCEDMKKIENQNPAFDAEF